jgi:hypothetical protein
MNAYEIIPLDDFQMLTHNHLSTRDYADDRLKTKHRLVNTFKSVSKEYSKFLESLLPKEDQKYRWVFEFNYSYSSVHSHSDNNYDDTMGMSCKRVLIIPIDWSETMKASTILFNQVASEKVFRNPDGLCTTLNKEKYNLDLDFSSKLCDEELIEYGLNPEYRKEYYGLTVMYNYVWSNDHALIFNSENLHTSNSYDKPEYKLSINGLGFDV